MSTITLQEAQATLGDLVHRLTPGEEVVITDNDRPIAMLVGSSQPATNPRRFGTLRGTVLSMEHFDDPLEEFEEYQ